MIRLDLNFMIIVAFTFGFGTMSAAMEEDTQSSIERINQRYDDFFRRQRELEKRDAERVLKSGEVKRARVAREAMLEEARASYVKSRKKVSENPRLEAEWNEHEKEWVESNKAARSRFVQKKQTVENMQKKGRRIPGNQEYDLED